MVKRSIVFLGCSICLFLLVCNLSTNKTNNQGKATNVSQLKVLNTDISGWTIASDADSFKIFNPANIYDDIDGGCEQYTNRGLIELADCKMNGPNGTILGVHFMICDFGNDSNATSMYNYSKGTKIALSQQVAVPQYDTSVAFANTGDGITHDGVQIFAHFKKFYFELPFANFTDLNQNLATASQFLGLFKSKIE